MLGKFQVNVQISEKAFRKTQHYLKFDLQEFRPLSNNTELSNAENQHHAFSREASSCAAAINNFTILVGMQHCRDKKLICQVCT